VNVLKHAIEVYKIITGKYDASTAPHIIRTHSTVINLD